MTLETDLTNMLGIRPLNDLLDSAEEEGYANVLVADVRAALAGKPLDGDQPEPVPTHRAQPGDVVLIRATADRWLDSGDLAVTVHDRAGGVCMAVPSQCVSAIPDPSWWPPQQGDVVLDRNGHVWEYDLDPNALRWFRPGDEATTTTEKLDAQVGPLDLLVRDGRRWSE